MLLNNEKRFIVLKFLGRAKESVGVGFYLNFIRIQPRRIDREAIGVALTY